MQHKVDNVEAVRGHAVQAVVPAERQDGQRAIGLRNIGGSFKKVKIKSWMYCTSKFII